MSEAIYTKRVTRPDAKASTKKDKSFPIAFAVLIGGALALRSFSGVSALDGVALLLLPVLLFWFRKNRRLTIFVTLLALWMLGLILSNTLHGVARISTANELQIPLYIGVSSLLLSWLARGSIQRLLGVVLGASLSSVLYLYVYPSEYFPQDPWKFGLALPVTIAALTLVTIVFPHRRVLPIVILASVMAYSGLNDFRNMAGVSLVGLILAIVYSRSPKTDSRFQLVKLAVGLVALVAVTFSAYALVASSGVLSYESEAKYQRQIQGGNVLLAARPELIGSFYAISSSPIVGLGSGASMDSLSQARTYEGLRAVGADLSEVAQRRLFGDGINSHSLLFSAWVNAGILGMLPWGYLIYLGLRAVVDRRPRASVLFLTSFWAVAVAWDTLFSPYSAHMQIMIGAFVALMTWAGPAQASTSAAKSLA